MSPNTTPSAPTTTAARTAPRPFAGDASGRATVSVRTLTSSLGRGPRSGRIGVKRAARPTGTALRTRIDSSHRRPAGFSYLVVTGLKRLLVGRPLRNDRLGET